MGDLSSEPSMEDILSSIKRIIAEEGEATPGRGRRAGRAVPPPASDDEVLELSNPMPKPAAERRAPDPVRAEPARTIDRSAPAEARLRAEPATPPEKTVDRQAERPATAVARDDDDITGAPEETVVSSGTVEATRGALDQLSRLLVKPEPKADGTLEGLVREMLRPMLRDWLDAKLPALVEEMVAREIERITSSRR